VCEVVSVVYEVYVVFGGFVGDECVVLVAVVDQHRFPDAAGPRVRDSVVLKAGQHRRLEVELLLLFV
jgi:hypothetical protein